MKIYELITWDLTGLARMGDEARIISRQFFTNADVAKSYAEKEHGQPINWSDVSDGYTSGDLRFTMYDIIKAEVIENDS